MKRADAIKEAQLRWGTRAAIHQFSRKGLCQVGRMNDGIRMEVFGSGATWEAAFRDAEKRQGQLELPLELTP